MQFQNFHIYTLHILYNFRYHFFFIIYVLYGVINIKNIQRCNKSSNCQSNDLLTLSKNNITTYTCIFFPALYLNHLASIGDFFLHFTVFRTRFRLIFFIRISIFFNLQYLHISYLSLTSILQSGPLVFSRIWSESTFLGKKEREKVSKQKRGILQTFSFIANN